MDVPLRPVSGRKCKVLFSYQPANDDELELKVGEIIDILSEVEEGWWKGKLNGQVGVFPSNFVSEVLDEASDAKETSHRKTSKSSLDQELSRLPIAVAMSNDDSVASSSDTPELPPKPKKELCRVMFPYEAVNDDELTLHEGDIITLISRDGQDVGWWRGELNGRLGVFPDNFVQVVPAEETRPARPPAKTNLSTTNRVKDSITRPNAAPQTTAHRKSLELPSKLEEKTSPPGVSKKPSLPPPPLKKPQRSPSGASINKTIAAAESKAPDSPTHNAPAKIPLTPLTFTLKQNSTVTTNQEKPNIKPDPDATDGGALSRNSGSFPLNNHDSDNEGELDLDCVGRSAMLSHPTASRVRAPRRRPPTTSPREGLEVGMLNGNAESHSQPDDKVNRPPWVEELKMNQAKKISAQGRTRVMIGSGGVGSSATSGELPTSPSPDPPKVSPSAVTLRGGSAQPAQTGSRPQSMFGGRSFSLSPSPSSPDTVTVSHKQWTDLNDKVQRLEEKLNMQQDSFTLALRELTNKLNSEVEKRQLMQAELEKLANFVTQV